MVRVARSTRPGKKWAAVFWRDGRDKTVHFGQRGASDYTLHRDPERRRRYVERHARGGRENWRDPTSPGALARYLLWNKPTLAASLADYRRRFRV